MKPMQNNLAGEALGYLNSIIQQGRRNIHPDVDYDGQLFWLVDLAGRGDAQAMGFLHDLSRPYYPTDGLWLSITEFLETKTPNQ